MHERPNPSRQPTPENVLRECGGMATGAAALNRSAQWRPD